MEKTAEYFNIQKYSLHDGPGIRTTLFLKGCPLRCLWCSNPESQKQGRQLFFNSNLCQNCGKCLTVCQPGALISNNYGQKSFDISKCVSCMKCVKVCRFQAISFYGKPITVSEAKFALLRDSSFYSTSGGGITISGGEPFLQTEFTLALLKELKASAVHTAIETSGYTDWKNMEKVIPYTDLFLFDIKEMDRTKHIEFTGVDNTIILDNLKKLCGKDVKIWIRMPIIPTVNDDIERIKALSRLTNNIPNIELIELLPYHQFGRAKYTGLGMKYAISNDVKPPENDYMLLLKQKMQQYFCTKIKYGSNE